MWLRSQHIDYDNYLNEQLVITGNDGRIFIGKFNHIGHNYQGMSTIVISTPFESNLKHKTSITGDIIDSVVAKHYRTIDEKFSIVKNKLVELLNEDCENNIRSFIEYENISL